MIAVGVYIEVSKQTHPFDLKQIVQIRGLKSGYKKGFLNDDPI